MKPFLSFVLFFSALVSLAQETASIPRWSMQVDAGIGFSEMKSPDFNIMGFVSRGQWRLLYAPKEHLRLEMGLGYSQFAQSALQQSEREYTSFKVNTVELPLKFVKRDPVLLDKLYLNYGLGFQLSAPIGHELKTPTLSESSSKGGTWFVSGVALVGLEAHASARTKLFFYGEYNATRQKGNYIAAQQFLINFSVIYML